MFPTRTITPDLAALDPRIAPLVHQVNVMGLATWYSCEGHGENASLIQSPFPMVVISPDQDAVGAMTLLRFMMMLGIHNDDPKAAGQDSVKWGLYPRTNACTLKPMHAWHSLEVYHQGIDTLVYHLECISRWYDQKKAL